MAWLFGGKKEEPEDEEEELEPVTFKGSINGVEPDVKANQRLLNAGLVPAKDMISEALEERADSIRLEPKGPQAVATFYVDGMPQPGLRMPKNEGLAVTQTLKLLAGLDIKVRNAPQAGGIKAERLKKNYHLMISTTPVPEGERVIIRCNDQAAKLDKPVELHMSEPMRQTIREFGTGKGLLLVVGPPGSGVTTTTLAILRGVDPYLYAVYTIGDTQGRNLEKDNISRYKALEGDDVGTTLDRLSRMEAHVTHVDPVKDAATAKMVCEKSQKLLIIAESQGKDACAGVQQMIEWTGDPKLVADNLRGVVSQKLLRALCSACKQAYRPKAEFLKKAGLPETTTQLYRKAAIPEENDPNYEPCEKCDEVGYKGRIAMFEFLVVTDEMKKLIAAKADASALRAQMRKEKQITFQSDALRLAAEGKTSLEEVQRVMKPA